MEQPTKVGEITSSEQVKAYKKAAYLIDLETQRLIELGAAAEQVLPGHSAYHYLKDEITRLEAIGE